MSRLYGASPQTVLEGANDAHLEELAIRGFTVIPDVVPANELAELRKALDAIYEIQKREPAGEFTLEDIQEENQVRAPLCYDEKFVEVARHPRIVDIVRRVLGNYFLIQLQIGIINAPKTENRQSIWHRDLLYHDYVSSRPLALSAMLCVDEFNTQTGGTMMIPHTHKVERMPSQEYIAKHAVAIDAKAGSFFIQDSMCFHQAGYNSSDNIRRGINTIYCSGLFKQQISLPTQLGGKYADDPFLAMLLGYDAEASDSVLAWRKRRFDKSKK
jgi:ectoine hydroxylase-related dioxygenase (phytanoyl-CoA dioxygenase family)